MSATTHGNFNFSLSNETGLYTESVSEEITTKAREIASGGGEVSIAAFYGSTGTFSIEGTWNNSTATTWNLGVALTLANTTGLEDGVNGYSSGAKYIVLTASSSLGAEAEERRTISGNIYPFLAAAN